MTIYRDEEEAIAHCRVSNQASKLAGSNFMKVVVDGPDEGEFAVMDIKEAIRYEFLYRWYL